MGETLDPPPPKENTSAFSLLADLQPTFPFPHFQLSGVQHGWAEPSRAGPNTSGPG